MSTFTVSRFCNRVPNDLLARTFREFGVLDAELSKLRGKSWINEWDRLEERTDLDELLRLMRGIWKLGSNAEKALLMAAEQLLPEPERSAFVAECETLPSTEAWLLRAWLKSESLFALASALHVIDAPGRSTWKTRAGVRSETFNQSPEALGRLSATVRRILKPQARGQRCKSRYLGLRDGIHFFLTEISDHDVTSEEWVGEEITSRRRTPLTAICFAYSPELGTLKVNSRGLGRVSWSLHEAFAKEILGLLALPNCAQCVEYRLDDLARRRPRLVIPPGSPILEIHLTELEVADAYVASASHIHRCGPTAQGLDAVYRAIWGQSDDPAPEVLSAAFLVRYRLKGGETMKKRFRLRPCCATGLGCDVEDLAIHEILAASGIEGTPEELVLRRGRR